MESLAYDSSVASPGSVSSHTQRTKRMRTSFKHHQLRTMKSYFAINQNPDAKDLKQLAQKTGLSKRVLQVSSDWRILKYSILFQLKWFLVLEIAFLVSWWISSWIFSIVRVIKERRMSVSYRLGENHHSEHKSLHRGIKPWVKARSHCH